MPRTRSKAKTVSKCPVLVNPGTKRQKETKQPATKEQKGKRLNFRSNELDSDPIINDLKRFKWDNKGNFNLCYETLDQIALEGLSGITFARLLYMLDAVTPRSGCLHDQDVQAYIWSILIKLMTQPTSSTVRAYFHTHDEHDATIGSNYANNREISKDCPSSSQNSKSPNKNLVLDKELKLPKNTVARMSMQECYLYAVQDGHIMGSCKSYLSRRDITDELIEMTKNCKSTPETIHAVNNRYKLDKIFFVANQEFRRKVILPDWADPNVNIKMREYACLELIGRTRTLGVVFPNDKAFGRYRILLTEKKFISQYQPKCTSFIVHHVLRFSKYISESPDDGKIYRGLPAITSNEKITEDDDVEDPAEADDDNDDGDVIPSIKSVSCNPRRLRVDCDMLKMVYRLIAFSKGRSPLDIRRKLRIPKFHIRNHLKNLANIELIGSHIKRIDDQTFRIYRARHKSLVYRRRLRDKMLRLKTKTSGRVKFDAIDLKAKKILGARRSQFSQAEDSLLVICRICCLLLEPNLTKKVSFCVNKRFIRDLMHEELCESHDKTADACLRRIKYLRKLPNNIMSVDELTAELREDADIVRFAQLREGAKTEEKLNKLFTQILRVVRAKLPHLLGMKSSRASNHLVAQRQTIKISSYADLKNKYDLIDCEPTSSSRYKASPGTTVLQLARPIKLKLEPEVSECNEMASIALLSSLCAERDFSRLECRLKIPSAIVGLDQGNESYKQLCAKAKDTTRELLSNLSAANPAADSRRALFMLRNELKSQALDKFGNLADALIVQPCNVRFSSTEMIVFDQKPLLDHFLKRSEIAPLHELGSLIKTIELALSWIMVMPGLELKKLHARLKHVLESEQSLLELLALLVDLELISEQRVLETRHYEPHSKAYIRFGQMLTLAEQQQQ